MRLKQHAGDFRLGRKAAGIGKNALIGRTQFIHGSKIQCDAACLGLVR